MGKKHKSHFKAMLLSNIQGLAFTFLIAAMSMYLSNIQDIKDDTHLASTAFAILIGVMLSPWYFKYHDHLQAGVHFSAKKLLRIGIIFYGFNVTLTELVSVGFWGFLLSIIIIVSIFLLALFIGMKVFKLDRETSMLVGAGSAICGAAAVLALESSLKSDPFKGILAVGTVVIFGLLCMFLYPALFGIDLVPLLDAKGMGVFMGATLHEVANVAGAAEMAKSMSPSFDQSAANLAVIVKMMRVIMLVPFLLIVTYFVAKTQTNSGGKTGKKLQIPYFAFAFLGAVVLNTYLNNHINESILGITYEQLINIGKNICGISIVFAMAALGLQIDFEKFLKSGGKVFGLALILTLVLIFGGYLITLGFKGILW